MGLAVAEVQLRNPRRPELGAVRVEALADTGSVHLCIPAALRDMLALEAIDTRPVTLADGSATRVPYVGPIETRCLDRVGFTGALVMGDQPLLGAVPMEDMDLVVVPKTGEVVANPANPDGPGSIAKLAKAAADTARQGV